MDSLTHPGTILGEAVSSARTVGESNESTEQWVEVGGPGEIAEFESQNIEVLEVFGSDEAIEVVRAAQEMSGYVLVPSPASNDEFGNVPLDGFEITFGPVTPTPQTLEKLRAMLLDQQTYGERYIKLCTGEYFSRLQFRHDRNTVDLLFCFSCDEMLVFHNGKDIGTAYFDNIRPEMIRILKEIFPDHKEVQSLS